MNCLQVLDLTYFVFTSNFSYTLILMYAIRQVAQVPSWPAPTFIVCLNCA